MRIWGSHFRFNELKVIEYEVIEYEIAQVKSCVYASLLSVKISFNFSSMVSPISHIKKGYYKNGSELNYLISKHLI